MSKPGCFAVITLLLASPIIWLLLPTRESFQAKRINQSVLRLPIGATKAQVAALPNREALESVLEYSY